MAEQITTNDLSHTVTTTDSEKECKPEGATEDSQPAVLLAIPPPAEYPWMYKGPALSMVLVLNCKCTGCVFTAARREREALTPFSFSQALHTGLLRASVRSKARSRRS